MSLLLKKPDSANIRTFLDKICPISGQCIAFGLETEKMRRYFNNYHLSHIDKTAIKRIGAESANGFVLEVPLVKDNYKLYTILKSAKTYNSDNLFYEALVGLYVNKKNAIFPCFLETYGVYNWPTSEMYLASIEGENAELNQLKPHKLKYDYLFNSKVVVNSCNYAKYMCVLIQHIHNARSLGDHVSKFKKNEAFFTFHLPQYLYQVYCPLAMMSNEFTHYDLHDNNVVLYTVGSELGSKTHKADGEVPNNGQYITMKYHYPNGDVVEFNTFDIVKILDYGRCYFKENDKYNSSTFLQLLRESMKESNRNGSSNSSRYGYADHECPNSSYSILEDEIPEGSFHYICSNKRNKSHDLRLAKLIWHKPDKYCGPGCALQNILSAIFYEDTYLINKGKVDNREGTKEVTERSYTKLNDMKDGKSIRNVEDMHLALKDLIMTVPHFNEMNKKLFEKYTKIGEMNIWLDGSRSLQYTVAEEVIGTNASPIA